MQSTRRRFRQPHLEDDERDVSSSSFAANLKWNATVLFVLALYCSTTAGIIGFRPDHAFLSLVVFVILVFGQRWGKLLLVDWSPFILFWVCYDLMRGIADAIRGRINVEEPFRLEQLLFGWLTPAEVPASYFQTLQFALADTIIKTVVDVTSTLAYTLHMVIPFLLAWMFWHTLNERRNFYLYVSAFTLLNAMALITFMIYPAAPPWYVSQYGFAQPSDAMLDSAGALVNFDRLIGHDVFLTLYATFNANLFAAIPSLHAGYPTLVALFVGLRFGGRAWAAVLYPCWAWFSAVYLNQHYIIDLLAGSVYAMIAFLVARTVIVPHLCDRIVDYDVTSRLLLAGREGQPRDAGARR